MQEHRHLGNGKGNGTGKGPPIALPQPSQERLTSLTEKQAKSTIADPYALGLVEGYTIDASTTNELCVVAKGSDGVRIHVQAPTGTEAYVFCDSNEEASKLEFGDEGETWSPTCPGEEICLQVMSESGEGDVQITEHTYVPSESESIRRRLGGGRRLQSLNCPVSDYRSCLVNAGCYEDAAPLRNAVAGYTFISGGYFSSCSGGLINSSNPNSLFLTAAHCIADDNVAKSAEFYGGAVLPCDDSCTASTPFWNLPRTSWRVEGSTLKYLNVGVDRAILELANSDVKQYALDWTNDVVPAGEPLRVVAHPKSGPQAFSNHVTKNKSCGLPMSHYIHAGYGSTGGQAPGSSGGIVVNSKLQIVGQLYGTCDRKPNYCAVDIAFGRLSTSFHTMEALLGPPSPPTATPSPTPATTPATPAPTPGTGGCVATCGASEGNCCGGQTCSQRGGSGWKCRG
mmetsp:Transcript_21418/g.42972  ORF Transcript_21418/g.42972 Transcript_21418/m.42972 type:complete len:454 (-) Transcript_21418:175-1536(-)